MKNLIRKIIKETEDYEFDWLSNDFNIELGSKFSEEDLCHKSQDEDCKVVFDDEYFTINLKYSDWTEDYVNIMDYDASFLDRCFNTSAYYGDDYDEVSDDEFNYIVYLLDEENRTKINNLLKKLFINKNVSMYNDNGNELFQNFDTIKDYGGLLTDVIYELSEAMSRNRRDNLKTVFDDIINDLAELGIYVDTYHSYYRRSELTIKIPSIYVTQKAIKGQNLTEIVEEISSYFDKGWSEMYYGNYDTSGSETKVNRMVGNYLDEVEEEIESSENYGPYIDLMDNLQKLKFYRSDDVFYKKIKNKYEIVSIKLTDLDFKQAKLKAYLSRTDLSTNTTKKTKYSLDFDDLTEFMYNYKLDI